MTLKQVFARTLVLAALSACSAGQSEPAARQAPAPAPSAPSAQPVTPPSPIIAWLDCVDCSEARLNAVRALGDAAVQELRTVLLKGPSQDRLDRHEQQLKTTFASLKKYEERRKDRGTSLSEQEYVRRYREKYIVLNRSRAARALGAIGTAQARTALSETLKTAPPPEVLIEVERALKEFPPPAVPNPDATNPDVTNPDTKKPLPPKPPANVKVKQN